jgi:hypothetical protein
MDLSQVIPDFPDVTQYAIPFFIAAILAELAFLKLTHAKNKAGFETRDTLTSLLMGTGNVVPACFLASSPSPRSCGCGSSASSISACTGGCSWALPAR